MRLSSKARYAVKAMLQLALNEGHGPVTLAEMSVQQAISLSYLEQLFASLRKQGLVTGIRGVGGGYRLGRSAEEVSVADIVTAVDYKAYVTRPENTMSAYDRERSQYYEMWGDLSKQLYEFLDSITLADFVRREDVQEILERLDSSSEEDRVKAA